MPGMYKALINDELTKLNKLQCAGQGCIAEKMTVDLQENVVELVGVVAA